MGTEKENELTPLSPASQSIIDKAKSESHQWLNPETWRTMTIVAQTFVQSGAMPKSMDTVPKVIVALQAGKEAGMQPLEAINSFYFVNGKVNIYGEMAIAQVLRAGHKIKWGECNATTASLTITRGDSGESMSATFTMEMARARGLTSNQVYTKYPENMLKFKAFNSIAKFFVADALHGVPIKEIEEAETIEEIPAAKSMKVKNPKDLENLAPGKIIPAETEEIPLSEAIKAPVEEVKEEKTPLEKVMETFPGAEVVSDKPAEKPLSKGMAAMKAAKEKTQSNK